MIFETLKILADQVNSYFGSTSITIENVAIVDSQNERADDIDDTVILSLINLQEENTLKNFPNKYNESNKVQYKNPIVNLNLFILFSANRGTYVQSLSDISKIVEFFQGKKVFTQANSVYNRLDPTLEAIGNFKFTIDLYTPSFEELNFIWGTLGGRQLPSVLYKLSLVKIERDIVQRQAGLISESGGGLGNK
ncbi:MAG: DUF4255 domain-containing protein [Flavobacteriales bacterium]|nr:DUF4255 domain-containing protein [Flavobacteriales bacterium]